MVVPMNSEVKIPAYSDRADKSHVYSNATIRYNYPSIAPQPDRVSHASSMEAESRMTVAQERRAMIISPPV